MTRKTRKHWEGTPRAVLEVLAEVGGSMDAKRLREHAQRLGGGKSTGNMALLRLQREGLIALEYRLTAAGAQALQETAP